MNVTACTLSDGQISGKKEDKKKRRGTRSTGGYKTCAWLSGPNHWPSSNAVTLHLFKNLKILSNEPLTYIHTQRGRERAREREKYE